MADEAAFLQAIREGPDDDGPRLVYADWLDEQGDPRGEFIRVQCRLERVAPDDPEAAALRQREAELLEQHRVEWEAVCRDLGLISWAYRRGLVEEVFIEAAAFAAQAARLFDLLPVRQVKLADLYRCDPRVLQAVAARPELARAHRLDLSNNHASSEEINAILRSPHLTGLTWLDLRGNSLILGTLALLAGTHHLPRLRSVLVHQADLTPRIDWSRHSLWQTLRSRYHGLT
jgi:uncharacterized protein (TIGR02996 family)